MSPKLYNIEDLTWDGRGVARGDDGRVVMIDGGLPGDTVRAKITSKDGNGPLIGRAIEVVTPSPDRVSHPCPHHFIECFNCPLGSFDYNSALEWKEAHLIETLKRIGKIKNPNIQEPIPSPHKWHYRDRLEPHLFIRDNRWFLGYWLNGAYSYIRSCLLGVKEVRSSLENLIDSLNKAASGPATLPFDFKWEENQSVARILLRANGRGDVAAVLFVENPGKINLLTLREALVNAGFAGWQIRHSTNGHSRFFTSQIIEMGGTPIIYHRIGDVGELLADPTVFLQVNHAASRQLIEKVLESLPEGGTILDLYGGYGSFALEYATRKQGQATVVENSVLAVRAGQKYAKKEELPVDYIQADLDNDRIPELRLNQYQAVLINPPRRGAEAGIIEVLNSDGPEHIIYISCHPATLARDIQKLTAYQALEYTPIDLFPQTPDVETVTILRRG